MFVYTYTHITHTHTFCFCSSLQWVFVSSFPELKLSQPHKGLKGMGGVLCLGWEQTQGFPLRPPRGGTLQTSIQS